MEDRTSTTFPYRKDGANYCLFRPSFQNKKRNSEKMFWMPTQCKNYRVFISMLFKSHFFWLLSILKMICLKVQYLKTLWRKNTRNWRNEGYFSHKEQKKEAPYNSAKTITLQDTYYRHKLIFRDLSLLFLICRGWPICKVQLCQKNFRCKWANSHWLFIKIMEIEQISSFANFDKCHIHVFVMFYHKTRVIQTLFTFAFFE